MGTHAYLIKYSTLFSFMLADPLAELCTKIEHAIILTVINTGVNLLSKGSIAAGVLLEPTASRLQDALTKLHNKDRVTFVSTQHEK
jgi:hypothetical protein